MKISQMIKHLNSIKESNGDFDCVLIDPDTGREFELQPEDVSIMDGSLKIYITYDHDIWTPP